MQSDYDYKCPNDHVYQVRCDFGNPVKGPKCPECKKKGERYITIAPGYNRSGDPDFLNQMNEKKAGW